MLRPLLMLAMLAAPLMAQAEGCDPPKPIRFAAGSTGAVLEGGVPPRMRDCLTITARAGQMLDASISSTDRDAVFQFYPPGWRAAQTADGVVDVAGRMLTGEDARSLRITLPRDGTYLFVIGSVRGGSDYRLTVSIK